MILIHVGPTAGKEIDMTDAAKKSTLSRDEIVVLAAATGMVCLPSIVSVPYRSGTMNRKLNLSKLADAGILLECTVKSFGNWGDDMLGKASLTDEKRRDLIKKRHAKMEGGVVPENGSVADPLLKGVREFIKLNRGKYAAKLKKLELKAAKLDWAEAKKVLGTDFDSVKLDEQATLNRRKGIIVSK